MTNEEIDRKSVIVETALYRLKERDYIAPGIVDERPIQEIEAFELSGFTQCHFFAGIGVWSHALRRAEAKQENGVLFINFDRSIMLPKNPDAGQT